MPQIVIWGGRALLAYAGISALGYGVGKETGKAVNKALPYAIGAGAVYLALSSRK